MKGGERAVRILLILSIAAALIFAVKALSYYLGVAGLLHYLEMRYNDMPDEETLQDLTLEAAENIIGRNIVLSIFGTIAIGVVMIFVLYLVLSLLFP